MRFRDETRTEREREGGRLWIEYHIVQSESRRKVLACAKQVET